MPELLTTGWQQPDNRWITSLIQTSAQLQEERQRQQESMALQLAAQQERERQHADEMRFKNQQEARQAEAELYKRGFEERKLQASLADKESARRAKSASDYFPNFPDPTPPASTTPSEAVVNAITSDGTEKTDPTPLIQSANAGDNTALAAGTSLDAAPGTPALSLAVPNPNAAVGEVAAPTLDQVGPTPTLPAMDVPPASMSDQLSQMGGAGPFWDNSNGTPPILSGVSLPGDEKLASSVRADLGLPKAGKGARPSGAVEGDLPSNPGASPSESLFPQESNNPLQSVSNQLGVEGLARVRAAQATGDVKYARQILAQEMALARKPVRAGASGPKLQMKIAQDGSVSSFNPVTGQLIPIETQAKFGRPSPSNSNFAAPEGWTPVPEHGTYKDPDGMEHFVEQNAKGQSVFKPFKPLQAKAKAFKIGSDKRVYAFGQDGMPMQPVPEDVTFDQFKPSFQHDNLGNVYRVGDDSKLELVIPANVKGKEREAFEQAAQEDSMAQNHYETIKAAFEQNPDRWFGNTKENVDKAKALADKTAKDLAVWKQRYPGTGGVVPEDKVIVLGPDGKKGRIPKSQLEEALKSGYRAL